jgi:hypothetical protein
MTVTKGWLEGRMVDSFESTTLSLDSREILLQGICLNSSGSVSVPKVSGLCSFDFFLLLIDELLNLHSLCCLFRAAQIWIKAGKHLKEFPVP